MNGIIEGETNSDESLNPFAPPKSNSDAIEARTRWRIIPFTLSLLFGISLVGMAVFGIIITLIGNTKSTFVIRRGDELMIVLGIAFFGILCCFAALAYLRRNWRLGVSLNVLGIGVVTLINYTSWIFRGWRL